MCARTKCRPLAQQYCTVKSYDIDAEWAEQSIKTSGTKRRGETPTEYVRHPLERQ